jgi:hypothetical protein
LKGHGFKRLLKALSKPTPRREEVPQDVPQEREECQGIGFSRAVKGKKHWASQPLGFAAAEAATILALLGTAEAVPFQSCL